MLLRNPFMTQTPLSNINETDYLLSTIFNDWLAWAQFDRRKKTWIRYRSSWHLLQEFFNSKKIIFVSQLSRRLASEFINWRLARPTARGGPPSKRSINIDLITLRAALEWARKREIITKNPLVNLEGILLKQKGSSLPIFFSLEQLNIVERLAYTYNYALYMAIIVLARTGMRSGEFCSLNVDNIDLEKRQIRLIPEQTKANYFRIIPIIGKAYDIIENAWKRAKQNGKEILFVNEQGNPHTTDNLNRRFRTLLTIAEKKGLLTETKRFHIHNLRATFISHMVMAGETPTKIMAIVGHRDWKTMQKYLGYSPNFFANIKKLPYQ